MKVCAGFLILIIAIQAASCNKTVDGRNRTQVSPSIVDCKHIKCSTAENPRCVRVVNKKTAIKPIFIIVLNKCELLYMKCHQDYQGKIVPMKYCGHVTPKAKKTNTVGHTRVKRDSNPQKPKVQRRKSSRREDGTDDDPVGGYSVSDVYENNRSELSLDMTGEADESLDQLGSEQESNEAGYKIPDVTWFPLISSETIQRLKRE
ncbi:uncharacterized protein LOC142985377 [Anticarsia gemmatalis]|uniref:uncharacterized protein LOC142985377 n=1 Tax=Anticarsia gemmatalis TaxID=129554 RepID=UPI003F7633B1